MANEDLLLRQMPHSLEGEQAVLGSMLIDADCVKDVMDKLRPSDFYLRQNREIFETIYSMFNYSLTIDPVTVLENMKQNGVYDENNSRGYLLQLMDTTPTAANVKEYIRPHSPGRPSRYGQDLHGFEHPAGGGQAVGKERGLFLLGNEPGAAGSPPHLQRVLCRQQKAGHR